MAVTKIKDELNITIKGEDKVEIHREIIDEYDFSNVVTIYKVNRDKIKGADNYLNNIDAVYAEEEKNIRDRIAEGMEKLKDSKKEVDHFFETLGTAFIKVIPDPEKGEIQMAVDHNILKELDQSIIDKYLYEIYNEYSERKKVDEQYTTEKVNEIVNNQLDSIKSQIERITAHHATEKEHSEHVVKVYKPTVDKILEKWQIDEDQLDAMDVNKK